MDNLDRANEEIRRQFQERQEFIKAQSGRTVVSLASYKGTEHGIVCVWDYMAFGGLSFERRTKMIKEMKTYLESMERMHERITVRDKREAGEDVV